MKTFFDKIKVDNELYYFLKYNLFNESLYEQLKNEVLAIRKSIKGEFNGYNLHYFIVENNNPFPDGFRNANLIYYVKDSQFSMTMDNGKVTNRFEIKLNTSVDIINHLSLFCGYYGESYFNHEIIIDLNGGHIKTFFIDYLKEKSGECFDIIIKNGLIDYVMTKENGNIILKSKIDDLEVINKNYYKVYNSIGHALTYQHKFLKPFRKLYNWLYPYKFTAR
jgi:hypothetical protein